MNSLLTLIGIETWKPVLAALVLPPVPFLLLMLIGARLILPRRGLGWFVLLIGTAGVWLSTCTGTGVLLNRFALKPPPALSIDDISELKSRVKNKQPVAIVVLGSGVEPLAPEYGVSNLTPGSTERLRYALWLSRETGAPVAFSGGLSWSRNEGTPEAQTAARIAAHDFGQQLKWLEDRSRDTRENALRTMPIMKQAGINHVVLVTHGWHMMRALKMFEEASGGNMKIQPAPMGLALGGGRNVVLDWLPSSSGYNSVNWALHELLGLLVQA